MILRKSHLQSRIRINDSIRYSLIGFITPLATQINMLFMIHIVSGSIFQKTLLGMNAGLGITSGIIFAFLFYHFKVKVNLAFFILFFTGGLGCIAVLFTQDPYVFLLCTLLSSLGVYSTQSIQSNLYNLYPKKSRAFSVSIASRYQSLSLMASLLVFAYILKDDTNVFQYQLVYGISATAYFIIAFFTLRFPPVSVLKTQTTPYTPIQLMKILFNDKGFLLLEFSWFFLGVGSLMILPYRANFLSESQFNFNYSAQMILVLLILIPEVVKFSFAYVFSRMFDKLPFYMMRIFTNSCYFFYILLFFLSPNIYVQVFTSVLLGVAEGTANLNGILFANKIAKRDSVSIYMLIHRILLAVRATVFPMVGLYLLHFSVNTILSISLGFIFLSTFLFIFNIKQFKKQ